MLALGLVAALGLRALAQPADPPVFGDASTLLERARAAAALVPPVKAKAAPAKPVSNPWRAVAGPSPRPPESIGEYSAGCLRGARDLEWSGNGFEVMRPSRRRNWGHPRLLEFLRALGASAGSAGLGVVLVGDLGQPRGGPTLSGHASHQTGLDVDVWFRRLAAGTPVSARDRETLSSFNMVVPDFERLSRSWEPAALELLRLAAGDGRVERIFVNPVIKREACRAHPGEAWLARLRPWWGHDDHFHVRLACAPGDARCRGQEAAPPGDGCGAELASWFTPERKEEARRLRTEPGKPPVLGALPAECGRVLTE